jgi:hypothetical protein
MPDEALRRPARTKTPRSGAAAREDFRTKREAKAAMLAKARTDKPIRYAYLGDCLRAALPKKSTVVVELGVPIDSLELEEPGSLLGVSIGGGLGFGLGASLGAKLAAPDRMVVATVGDGSYMFGNPTPFHFVSRAANLPTLTIVCNNMRWQAVESATRVVYPQGLSAAARPMPLVELQPSPEFTKVAEASDAWTRRVDEPADVPRALDDALAAVAGAPGAARCTHTRRPLTRKTGTGYFFEAEPFVERKIGTCCFSATTFAARCASPKKRMSPFFWLMRVGSRPPPRWRKATGCRATPWSWPTRSPRSTPASLPDAVSARRPAARADAELPVVGPLVLLRPVARDAALRRRRTSARGCRVPDAPPA